MSAGATAEAVAASLGHASFSTTARHYVAPSVLERAGSERVLAVLEPASPAVPAPRPDLAQLLTRLSAEERAQLASLLAADAVRSEGPVAADRSRKKRAR